MRVHQFGGNRPRRRPQTAETAQQPATAGSTFQNLLPLLLLFLIPLLSSLFSSDSTPTIPRFSVDTPSPPLTQRHVSARLGIPYYVNPEDITSYTRAQWKDVDTAVENNLIGTLRIGCEREQNMRERMINDAQGWFFVDQEKYQLARNLEMPNCNRLEAMRVRIR